MWQKLRLQGIKGKCFTLIQNVYNDIKSKIRTHEGISEYFQCNIGVRQGENVSPFLFSIFLNDLENYLLSKNVTGVECNYKKDDITMYLKLIILLYADDTVLFSDSKAGLQFALNTLADYCTKWKLQVNTTKMKIFFFHCRGNVDNKYHFCSVRKK